VFEAGGFLFIEVVLNDAVNASAARAAMEAQAQFGEIGGRTGCDDLDVALFSVANPAGKAEFAGLAMDKPAKTNTLNATLNEKMKNHGWGHRKRLEPVLQMERRGATGDDRRQQISASRAVRAGA